MPSRVSYKVADYVTPRSRQLDYPLLGFLFQVATVSRLCSVAFGKVNTLVPDIGRIDAYLNLTTEEKYVFLLETAWCYVDWATLDGDDRSGQGAEWFRSGYDKLLTLPTGTPVVITQQYALRTKSDVICLFPTENPYIRAGYWFGWYGIHEVSLPKRNRYTLEIDGVTLTDWGRDCLTVLRQQRPFHYWNKNAFSHLLSDADEGYAEAVDVNHFANVFRTLLDEPELISLYPINPNSATGTYWLRVELPNHGMSRTLALPATHTLDDLHVAIQQAVRFDDDHLYRFYLNPRNPYTGEQYYDPRTEEGWVDGYPAAETTLAMLNLYEGQRFLYVFDFGDNREFQITVARHLPDEQSTKIRVVDKVGKAPRQHSSW